MTQKTSPVAAVSAAPIDLAHLRNMTSGDRSVEIEVLGMFARQAQGLLGELQASGGEITPMSVHTIKGSARGIGAGAVAAAAEAVEKAQDPAEIRRAVMGLAVSLTETKDEIARLLKIL